MILAMVEDARVVLIKLVERLCVLREMDHLSTVNANKLPLKSKRFMRLLHRLNINALKWEMEDLAFRYFEPEIYHEISQGLKSTRLARSNLLKNNFTKFRLPARSRAFRL